MENGKDQEERTRSCCCGYKSSISILTLGTLIAVAANFLPKLFNDTVKKVSFLFFVP